MLPDAVLIIDILVTFLDNLRTFYDNLTTLYRSAPPYKYVTFSQKWLPFLCMPPDAPVNEAVLMPSGMVLFGYIKIVILWLLLFTII